MSSSTQETPIRKTLHILEKVLDWVLPVAISATLVIWLFHKVKFADVITTIRNGCDFRYVILMMAITTLSHITRGVRWGIQLRGAGIPRMSVNAESVSIFGAYALNLVFPRLGEAWRCLYVSRRENAPLTTVIGTDLGDRISDLVVVISLVIVALIVAHPALYSFITHYSVGRDIDHIVEDKWLWIGIAAFIGIFWYICHYLRQYRWVAKMDAGIARIWQGFKVLFTMKGKTAYLFLTLGIWTCYFMETYVMFFAFPFTRELVHEPGLAAGFIPGLVVFVFGSLSMGIPSNGGLGPWNLAVMFALSLYGIGDTEGATFSMVMWSCQAAWLVVLGLYSAAYVMLTKKSNDKAKLHAGGKVSQPSHNS